MLSLNSAARGAETCAVGGDARQLLLRQRRTRERCRAERARRLLRSRPLRRDQGGLIHAACWLALLHWQVFHVLHEIW